MNKRTIRKITTKNIVKPAIISKVNKITPKNTPIAKKEHGALTTPIKVSDSELLSKIKKSIADNTPLSVSRCGDGEFHLIKNESDFFDQSMKRIYHSSICLILDRNKIMRCDQHSIDKINSCKCYLNNKNAVEWLAMMKAKIINTIKNSDFVGLSVPHKNSTLYGIAPYILKRNGIDLSTTNTINSLFPRSYEFGSLTGFKNIIGNNHIHLITSNANLFMNRRLNKTLGTEVTYTNIPKYASYKSIEKVKSDVSSTKSNIIFFAGGGGIKDLIPWAAKEHGKIAIDVGSIVDPWCGVKSRPAYEKAEFKHVKW